MKSCCGILFALLLSLAIASCSSDDAGEGIDSLQAEMCDIHTVASKTALSCRLDDDRMLEFAAPLNVQWAQKADSTYRALLYYNKVEGSDKVDALSAVMALALNPVPADKEEWAKYSDPVGFVSAWKARNGRYVNVCLSFKTGAVSGKSHKLAVVCDSVSAAGSRYYYRFCHSQEGIPTDYGVEEYMSVAIDSLLKGDTVSISVPTFKGMVCKDFVK